MESRCVAIAILALSTMGWMGCKEVEHERRDLANEIVAAAPECRGWAAGHDRRALIVFCEDASGDYVESVVMPSIKSSCDDLKRLEFEEVTIYGPKGSQHRWGAQLDKPSCELASR
jgi:hypothetical protein